VRLLGRGLDSGQQDRRLLGDLLAPQAPDELQTAAVAALGRLPFADSEELVRNSGLPAWALVEVGSDHRLADPESLEAMLEACLVDDEDEAPDEEADDILERDWTGLCYTAALRWAREAEERDWLVVHGTVLSERGGKRIEHAWCERGDVVVDLALPAVARVIGRERYYRVLQPEVRQAYPCEEALLLAIRSRHDGPWDDTGQRRG
jgi:hypothetical protein